MTKEKNIKCKKKHVIFIKNTEFMKQLCEIYRKDKKEKRKLKFKKKSNQQLKVVQNNIYLNLNVYYVSSRVNWIRVFIYHLAALSQHSHKWIYF